MPIPLAEYLSLPPTSAGATCTDCGCALQTVITGRNPVPAGVLCDDCCFDALGALAEQHPVGRVTRTYGT